MDSPTYVLTRQRWVVLGTLALLSMSNAFLIYTFTAIFAVTQDAFGTTTLGINTLVNTQAFVYFPASIVGIFLTQKLGLRASLLIAATLNTACAIIHYIAIFVPGPMRYGVLVFGTIVGGLAQPLVFNVPPLVSSLWFGADERDLATAIGSLSNVLGNAIASVVPPMVVFAPADLRPLLLGRLITMLVLLVAAWVFAADKPPSPPSASAAIHWQHEGGSTTAVQGDQGGSHGHGGQGHGAHKSSREEVTMSSVLRSTLASFATILSNRNFARLAIGFGIGAGCFNAVIAVIAQLVAPCGYSADVAGVCGAAMLGTGLVMAGIVGQILDRTHAYVPVLRVCVACAFGGTLFMLSSLTPGNEGRLYAAFAVLGASLLPLLPVALETAVETSYPAAEDVSAGAMLNFSFLFQIGVLYGITPILDLPSVSSCNTVATPSAGLIAACLLASACLMGSVQPEYKRQAVERRKGGCPAGAAGLPSSVRPSPMPSPSHGPEGDRDKEVPLLQA